MSSRTATPNILSLHIGALGIDGGVAQVALSAIEAFAGAHGGAPWNVRALSLLGDANTASLRAACSIPERANVRYRAFQGSRPKFARAAIAAAIGWADVVFVDHLNMAPVGFAAAAIARAPKVLFAHTLELCPGADDLDRPTQRPTPLRSALLSRFDAIASNSASTARLLKIVSPHAPAATICAPAPRALREIVDVLR
ncbi:MAG: hypothetical protein ACHREM_23795, partial [Polyangiales bacterium]